MPDPKTIKSYANYRKASRYLYKADIAVQLEYYEDIPFWTSVFKYARPARKIKYYYADTIDGKNQSGKSVCKRYIPYADSSLIVCVDSDFDTFLHSGSLSVKNYILQTYTYSWENHYCYTVALQNLWQDVGVGNFNFTTFITGLNNIIYDVLLNILTARTHKLQGWALLDVCGKILHPSVAKVGALDNDGAHLLEAITTEVQEWIAQQPVLESALISKTETLASAAGLTPNTAYLYFRGHCIYDLILKIGNALSGNNLAFKPQVLDAALQMSGYPEIEHVISDVKTLL